MTGFLVVATILVAVLIAAGLERVWAGPTSFDRLIAVALVTVNGVIVIMLLAFVTGRLSEFLDIALAYALLAFLFPIAIGRYYERHGSGTHPEDLDHSAGPEPGSDGISGPGRGGDRGRA